MLRFTFHRVIILLVVLFAAHFFGYAFTFAEYARNLQNKGEVVDNVWGSYRSYLTEMVHLDFGSIGKNGEKVQDRIIRSSAVSCGVLAIAFIASTVVGFVLGFVAASTDPPRVRTWLAVLATIGLSMPAFYLGSLIMIVFFYYLILLGPNAKLPLPLQGFGWDSHLVLPVLVLMTRPAVQIAQVTAEYFSNEFGKQYVVAARSFGHTWRKIRTRHALRNILVPVVISITASLKLLICELIVVEWLFGLPGLGRLLILMLVRNVSFLSNSSNLLYNPQLTSAIVGVFAALFLSIDFLGSVLIYWLEPRYRV